MMELGKRKEERMYTYLKHRQVGVTHSLALDPSYGRNTGPLLRKEKKSP